MNKAVKISIGVFVLLIAVVTVLSLTGVFKLSLQSGIQKTFTPVWCNNYEFTCCVPNNQPTQQNVGYTDAWQCPNTGLGCKVTFVDTPVTTGVRVYHGSGSDCQVYTTLWIFKYFSCDNEQYSNLIKGTADIDIAKGEFIWTDSDAKLSITQLNEKLVFAGRSGATIGQTIKTGSCVYDLSSGEKLTSTKGQLEASSLSYTVPQNECALSWQPSDRFICGSLEEQCSSDADCGGHTYGNSECNARTLQTYGCSKTTPPANLIKNTVQGGFLDPALSVNRLSESYYTQSLSRCTIQSAKTVQCCGDTDCGTNAFCDKTTFTCQQNVECRVASDCAVSQQCDYSTKKLKTPICTTAGECDFKTTSVQCCADSNCNSDQFCNNQNKCELKPVVKTECPTQFQCCQSEALYFDKTCATGLFCNNHNCQATPECKSDSDCKDNWKCDVASGKCIEITPETCEDKFFGLIPASMGVKEDCGFLCMIGLKDPEKVNVCVYDKTPLVLIILGLVGIVAIIVFGTKKGGKKGKGGALPSWLKGDDNILKNKKFWTIVGIVVGIFLLIGYFQYIFWFTVIAIILAIIYIVIRIFVFKKIW
jgi:hypothetical protein